MLLFLVAAMMLAAGCAPSAGSQPDAGATATATPDPLYSLNCIRNTGRNDLCYAGQMLLGDNERLEQAARDYCTYTVIELMCSVHIWADEASVAQAIPLTEAEKATRIARIARKADTQLLCFELFDQGTAIYSSPECGK